MQVTGILLGLLSALGASLAYLCSRRYAVRAQRDEPDATPWRPPLRLLVTAHVWLGLACLAGFVLMLVITRPTVGRPAYATLMSAGVALFYLLGNVFLFLSLQRTDASRVAPLLGMKIILLALTVELFMGEDFTPAQWAAVVMATGAAVMLGTSGGRLPVKTLLMIGATCAGFVCSDLFIKQMIPAWLPEGLALKDAGQAERITAAMTGMALAYVWCGVAAVAMLPVVLRGYRAGTRALPPSPSSKGEGRGGGRGLDPRQPIGPDTTLDPLPGPLPEREGEHCATRQAGFAEALIKTLPGGLPYASAWFMSMVCLFSCFSLVGIVYGGILQSTRGLMSIGLGVLLAWLGHHHLERHAPWPVVVRRIIAAAVMTAAIALYSLGNANG